METIQNTIIKITPHAQNRMHHRGSSPRQVASFLEKCDKLALFKNRHGYEIIMRGIKGRLVGKFSNRVFICLTFLRFPDNYDQGICQFKIGKPNVIFLHDCPGWTEV